MTVLDTSVPNELIAMQYISFELRIVHPPAYAKAARSLISTLDAVDQHPQLYFNKNVLRRAIYRYEHVWIPLLTRVPQANRIELVPPLDVEWVWMCHMLAPHIYAVDSAAIWQAYVPYAEGHVVDHVVLDTDKRRVGLSRAETLWRLHFPEETFNILEEIDAAPLSEDTPSVPAEAEHVGTHRSRITYDITAAAERQMAFHYQVAYTPQYRQNDFLETAATRYEKFLRLYSPSEGGRRVPTYDIDLMWHTHQLHPRLYARQTKEITGRLLPHDDTLNDRSEGGQLLQRWEATKRRWNAKYGGSICRMGGMYRGTMTAAERLLRTRLDAKVADLSAHLLVDDGNGFSMTIRPLRESVVAYAANGSVEWLHHTGVSKSLKAGCKGTFRISEMAITDTMFRLEARLTNVLAMNFVGVESAVEFFDACRSSIADALPLASLHVAPAGSVVHYQPDHASSTSANQSQTLVLRIAGRDVALLSGRLLGGALPLTSNKEASVIRANTKSSMPGEKDTFERSGLLRLAIMFLGDRPRWSELVHETIGRAPTVAVVGRPENVRFRVDLTTGTVRFCDKADAVLAGVVGMGVALLHVRLQPRLPPWRQGREKGLQWMLQEQEYSALAAGGGDLRRGEQVTGYGHLLGIAYAQQKLPQSIESWTSSQRQIWAPYYNDRREYSFDTDITFGSFEGRSFITGGGFNTDHS